MSQIASRPAIAGIIAAHQGLGNGGPDPTADLQSGIARAIRLASVPFDGLSARPGAITVTRATTLSEAMAVLPDTGLLAAIEDDQGRRGLVALSHPLVDALIEVQTTGRVEEAELPPRPVTRIDEALCRDFLDMIFAAFARETIKAPARDWPDRLSYGSRVAEAGQLNLLLPEQGYHQLAVEVSMGADRKGQLLILLPRDPLLIRKRAQPDRPGAPPRPEDWGARMLDALGTAPLSLDAVLFRVSLPFGTIEALEEGALIDFDPASLGAVSLEGDQGHVFAQGGLGQLAGKRAVRLGGPSGAGQPAAVGTDQPVSAMAPPAAATPPDALPSGSMAGLPALGGTAPEPALIAPETPAAPAPIPAMATGFDPDAPMPAEDAMPPAPAFDPNAPIGDFDPNAPIA